MKTNLFAYSLRMRVVALRSHVRGPALLGSAILGGVLLTGTGCSTNSNEVEHAHASHAGIVSRPEQIAEKELHFALPSVERWTLPNGLVVLYKFDDELPLISGQLFLPGGSLQDPPQLVGLAKAMGGQMRAGSVNGLTPAQLDEQLNRLAASIESTFGAEYGAVTFSCLTEDFSAVFDLFGRVVREPSFDEQRFSLWQRIAIEGVKRRRDDPNTVAGLTFAALLFGETTPWGRIESRESIGRITRADMLRAWKQFSRADGALLAASGSLPTADFRKKVEERFGDWAKGAAPRPKLPPVTFRPKPGIYVLDRDFDQATVYIGHHGPPRLTPDIYQMSIYNRILAGGFGSILFDEIRTKRGLAYDVDGGLAPGAVKGTFTVHLGTRNEAVIEAIQESRRLVAKTLTELPDDLRFGESKSAVERSFIFRFDDSSQVVQRAATQELLHYPVDFDRTYLERVSGVTPQFVNEVAKRWVQPDQQVVVVVGRLRPEDVAKAFAAEGIPVYRFEFDTKPRVVGQVR